ncbi:MAG: formimidoylglutamate deiminase [Burkholderiales bacterium]|nr:formimidoylglutamate deiminase [Burkholderiales bacterium]
MPDAPARGAERPSALWAPWAWLPSGWRAEVLLTIDGDGCWDDVRTGVRRPPAGTTVLAAPLLPGMVNAHSHAFQRAFAGMAERRESGADDFWSWRDRMYSVALRITPAQLSAVAAQLYLELLRGGYTQVCEFHYLQRDPEGQPYPDALEMAWSLAEAADTVGIGLTLMPALYERAGFAEQSLRPDQRRFSASALDVWNSAQRIASSRRDLVNAGLVIHSLRAASPESIHALAAQARDFDGPIHIHVAEQIAEVDDCVAATGSRPIAWLASARVLDRRWQLVHATHATPTEIDAVAASGAGIVLCPTTEANLGDGFANLPAWLAAGVPMSIGSDSHVTRDWREELRWLEYGQRLVLWRRNVSAAPEAGVSSTAERLVGHVLRSSARPAGATVWGFVPGARADVLVAEVDGGTALGLPLERRMDALVFSSPAGRWRDVMVAGRWTLRHDAHRNDSAIRERFVRAMEDIWSDTRES